VKSDNCFKTLTPDDGVAWAYTAAKELRFQRKVPGGKEEIEWTLHGHNVEGTPGFYVVEFVRTLEEKVLDALTMGVPDYGAPVGEDGKPPLKPLVDMPGAPSDPAVRRRLFQYVLTSPLKQSGGDLSPTLRTKVSYEVATVEGNADQEVISLGCTLLNADSEPGADGKRVPVPIEEQLKFVGPHTRAVLIAKVNPLKLMPKQICLTMDVMTLLVKPNGTSA
jgi:hypothetical protein